MAEASLPAIVDFERYPLDDLESARGAAFLADCRAELRAAGALLLPGFLKAEALPGLIAEAAAGAARSPSFLHRFPYGTGTSDDAADLAGLPDDDPRRSLSRTALRFVAEDLIPAASPLRALYDWPGTARFLTAVLGRERLYRRRDGLSGLNCTAMEAGDEQAWHYDEAHFSTTILLQAPDAGGHFEYVPGLRGPAGDDLDGVKLALTGRHPGLIRLPLAPGTLSLFEGRFAFHRATPVEGPKPRYLTILAFDERPGVCISDELSEVFYGRKVAAPRAAASSGG